MREHIKKYYKFWPILGIIALFSAHFIYERPRVVEDILGISSDTTFEYCHVEITEWTETIPSTKSTELTEDELKQVVEMMRTNKYRKYSGKTSYTSDAGSYYSMTFSYFINENKEKRQRLTITQGDLIDINGSWYYVSSGDEREKEVVPSIYEYTSGLIE